MPNLENSKKYTLFAAACSIIHVLYLFVQSFLGGYFPESLGISWIIWVGVAVALVMQHEKAMIVLSGALFLMASFELIELSQYASGYGPLYGLFFLLGYFLPAASYAALIVLLVLTLKENAVVKKIWFISGSVFLAGYFSEQIVYVGVFDELIVDDMPDQILIIAALLLVGMWLKEKVTAAGVTEDVAVDSQTVSSASASTEAIGGADKLKMYKDLLDSGAITQEEFDAKKKQILGL